MNKRMMIPLVTGLAEELKKIAEERKISMNSLISEMVQDYVYGYENTHIAGNTEKKVETEKQTA